MITVSIDVGKIDKSRFFVKKDGSKWLDLVLIETPKSKYSDYLVKQSQTKEARDRGEKGEIIGNAKLMEQRKRSGGGTPQRGGDDGDDW